MVLEPQGIAALLGDDFLIFSRCLGTHSRLPVPGLRYTELKLGTQPPVPELLG